MPFCYLRCLTWVTTPRSLVVHDLLLAITDEHYTPPLLVPHRPALLDLEWLWDMDKLCVQYFVQLTIVYIAPVFIIEKVLNASTLCVFSDFLLCLVVLLGYLKRLVTRWVEEFVD